MNNSYNSAATHLIQLCQDNLKEQIAYGLTIIPDVTTITFSLKSPWRSICIVRQRNKEDRGNSSKNQER